MHKWGLSRLDNVERVPNYQAERGTTVHNQLEAWLKKGTEPITRGMAKVFAHFPAPGSCDAEGEFGFVFGRPDREYIHKGRFDVRLPGVIQDLKTTGDLRWRKTEAQLRADLQANVYALAEMLRSGVDTVTCKWVYAQVPTPVKLDAAGEVDHEASMSEARNPDFEIKRVEVTETTLTRAEVMRNLSLYVPLAERMMEAIEEGKKAADLPKNSSSCEAYGGCPFKKSGACEVPPGGGLLAILKQEKQRDASKTASGATEKKMGLGNRLLKKSSSDAAPSAPPPPPEAPRAAQTETKPSSALTSRIASLVGGAKSAAVKEALEKAPEHSVHATGINPPDAAPPWTQEEQAAQAQKIADGVKAPKGTDALPAESVTAQTVAAQEAEIEAEKVAKKAAKKVKGSTTATTAPVAMPHPGHFVGEPSDALVLVLTRIADLLEKIANKT